MYASVNEDLAYFLYDNNLVPQSINLFYIEIEEINRPKETIITTNNTLQTCLPDYIKLKGCKDLQFIPGKHIKILN